MKPTTFIFLYAFLLFSYSGFCEIHPAENSKLNYTTVYFSENFISGAKEYELEVYSDSLLTQKVTSQRSALPAFWVEDLSWASRYFWKISGYDSENKQVEKGNVHVFSILKITYMNYDEIRVDVKKNNTEKNAGGFISIDYTKSIINRKGKPVWVIPHLENVPVEKMYIRDMRITHDNTVTFLTFQIPCEIDFNGKVVWQAPYPFLLNSDTVHYHHDFKKTSRGTYMVMADRHVYRRLLKEPTDIELKNSPEVKRIQNEWYKKTYITFLLEFDKDHKLIWYWDANEYLKDIDLNWKKMEMTTPNFATHANAFGENKEGTKIYIGFRDLSRIIKIDKKTKKVEHSYGEVYPSGEANIPVEMNNQHDANPSDHNSIYVFNNNGFKEVTGVSTILELKDNVKPGEDPIIWKFDLNFDPATKGKSANGGNIVELPNSNLLFCAGSLHRIFEISKKREIVWDAMLYSRGIKDTAWKPFPQYRSNWIPQLNWYYFMSTLNAAPIKKGKHLIADLTIYNTGNIEDAYEIQILSGENVLLQSLTTPVVKKNESIQHTLRVKTKEKIENLKILVRSKRSEQRELIKITRVTE